MAAALIDDLQAFNRFVDERLDGDGGRMSLEEGLAVFRRYQEELRSIRQKIGPALDQLDAGGGTELDIEAIIAEGRRRFAAEGMIT